jgi:hypothetical protein
MLTRTMPSVMRALQGSLDSQTLKAFTQALGNCNQSLEHRGDVAAQPNNLFIRQGEYGGDTYNSGYSSNNFTQYNPTFQNFFAPNFPPFNPIFPPPFNPDPILPPVISPGDTNISIGGDINNTFNNNNYNSSFFFPTTNFFGGPTNNYFGGNTTINNSTTNNAYTTNNNTQNFYVTNINGRPIAGPSGPPGQPGRDGRDGRDGAPGAPGASLPPVGGIILPPGAPPPPPPVFVFKPMVLWGQPYVETPVYKLDNTLEFDPETCKLTGSISLKEDTERFLVQELGPGEQTPELLDDPAGQ